MDILRNTLVFVFAATLCVGCNLKDPVGSVNNNDNSATNNTNNENNVGTNSVTSDAGNNATDPDMDTPDPDMGTPPEPLPSSAAVTGGTLEGESDNYKVKLQVGAPHAAPKPSSDNYEAQIAPPSTR